MRSSQRQHATVLHPQKSLVRRAGRDSGGWARLREHELAELGRPTVASTGRQALRTKALVHALRGARIFSSMGEMQLSIMASGGKKRRLPRYASLCREGGRAESFFVLERGTLELSKLSGERRLVSCAEGDRGVVLGTEGLSGQPRLESCCAAEPCELVEFATSSLKISATGALALSAIVFEAFVEAELRAMRLFRGLPARVLQSCAPLFSLASLGANEAVFEEDAPGNAFYVLTHGRVEVHKDGQTVAVLDAADGEEQGSDGHCEGHPFFGEMALLDGKPRMAGVRSVTPCTLLVLGRAQFNHFLQLVPDFKPRLRRLKELRRKQTEINLVSVGGVGGAVQRTLLLEKQRARAAGRRQGLVELSSVEASTQIQRSTRGMLGRRKVARMRGSGER